MKRFLIVPLLICICTFGLVSCKTPEPSPVLTVPAPPIDSKAEPGNWKINVEWTPSDDDGGSPVLGFRLGICEGEYGENDCIHGAFGDFEWQTFTVGNSGWTTTIGSLNNNKTYTIRIRSFNAIGDSRCFWMEKVSPCPVCQG